MIEHHNPLYSLVVKQYWIASKVVPQAVNLASKTYRHNIKVRLNLSSLLISQPLSNALEQRILDLGQVLSQ